MTRIKKRWKNLPSWPPCQPEPMRSPTVHAVTLAPTAATRPIISCPGIIGLWTLVNKQLPCRLTPAEWNYLQATAHAVVLCKRVGVADTAGLDFHENFVLAGKLQGGFLEGESRTSSLEDGPLVRLWERHCVSAAVAPSDGGIRNIAQLQAGSKGVQRQIIRPSQGN